MLNKSVIDQLMHEFAPMGFNEQDVLMAYLNSNGRKNLMLDYLLTRPDKTKNELTFSRKLSDVSHSQRNKSQKLGSSQNFEKEIQKAIRLSIEEGEKVVKPEQLLRKDDTPVGMKNIGNTCYFNSLIQTIFQIKDLLTMILTFKAPTDIDRALAELEIIDEVLIKRKKASIRLIFALQKLFAMMLFGKKNIINPQEVLQSVVDSQANPVTVGEQLDITEFSNNLFERLEEGLSLSEKAYNNICFNYQSLLESKGKEIKLSNIFFGSSKDFITFDWAEVRSKKEIDSSFGPISININEKDLMSGLDAFTNFSVDGYKSPNFLQGEVTAAKKRIWITQPPKVLTFVLQRLIYDKEKGLQKLTEPFHFPKEIFLDRFLFDNKKELKLNHDEKKGLKAKEKRIDNILERLKDYKDSKLGVSGILDLATNYIGEQIEELEKDFVEVNSDSADEKIDDVCDAKELKKINETLIKIKERVQIKIDNLEKKKAYIKKKIESSFSNHKSLKYNLHSIVVHEGGPNGGHYYSLIYDSKNKKWRKFNDSIVTEITQEEVDKLSIGGGKGTACAYCLFYAQEGCEIIDLRTKSQEQLRNLLAKEMNDFVLKENAKFEIELQHSKTNIMKSILSDYSSQMSTIGQEMNKYIKELQSKGVPSVPLLPSFNGFLLLENFRGPDLIRWNTLKSILREKKVPYNLLEGETNNFYYRELRDAVVSPSCTYNLKSLELTEKQYELLFAKRKEYLELYKVQVIIQNTLELLLQKKWKEAMTTISFLHEKLSTIKLQDYVNQFYLFASYLLAIMALKFCNLVEVYLNRSDSKEALAILEILIYALNKKQTIKPQQVVYTQVVANLYSIINTASNKTMKESDIAIFIHYTQKIEEKCDFLPSFDVRKYISPELLAYLDRLEDDDNIYYSLEKKISTKPADIFSQLIQDKLKIWNEFEGLLRKKNTTFDQDFRISKEKATWNAEP